MMPPYKSHSVVDGVKEWNYDKDNTLTLEEYLLELRKSNREQLKEEKKNDK